MKIVVKKALISKIKEREIKDKETQKVTGVLRQAVVQVVGASFDVECDALFQFDELKQRNKFGTIILDVDVSTSLKMQFGKSTYDAPVAILPQKIMLFKEDKELDSLSQLLED